MTSRNQIESWKLQCIIQRIQAFQSSASTSQTGEHAQKKLKWSDAQVPVVSISHASFVLQSPFVEDTLTAMRRIQY